MRKVIFLLFLAACMPVAAQDLQVVREGCMPPPEGDVEAAARADGMRRLPDINTTWDANRVYHQLVILISFSDTDFKGDNPREDYNRMLNEPGYNLRKGPGCAADYFKVQSRGLFNVQFDVYGPYKTSGKAQPYDNPTANTKNYGTGTMREATNMFLAANPDLDFSQYDWNGDGSVNQVVYVCAGLSGNQSSEACYGHIWPNTSSFSAISTPDGKKISNYSSSCELWSNGTSSCGFGTICHEYTHALGLPDIYPTSSSAGYSVVDEWDLMDGGNFTNFGWCPPNYTPLEKMLLGWLTPTELSEPTTISNLKTAEEGGEVYIVRNTAKEYYLIENRQWKGWDSGAPGQGLVVYHVNYDASKWASNNVNNTQGKYNFHLIAADNMDYDAWQQYLVDSGASTQYANNGRMNNLHLSGAPYPLLSGGEIMNNELTDSSVPASVVYNQNADGNLFMSKPITNIVNNEDGTVSFLFMGGDSIPSGIAGIGATAQHGTVAYDLTGRRTDGGRGLFIVRCQDGTIRKIVR
ncbi:MAG: M6 family metalloprotease domain-containing protein [Prevotella sp.]|nr:M6 family metalloprotease domain-containing protein [Prevotella sp.]